MCTAITGMLDDAAAAGTEDHVGKHCPDLLPAAESEKPVSMNNGAQRLLKLLGTMTMAVVALVLVIAGAWLGIATHEFGHAIGCVASGRAITGWSVVSQVECGSGFSAPDAWRIGPPAYVLPLVLAIVITSLGRRVMTAFKAASVRFCVSLFVFAFVGCTLAQFLCAGWFALGYHGTAVYAPGAGDVRNFLAATRVDHVTLTMALWAPPVVVVVITRHSLWRSAKSWVAALDSSSDQITAHLGSWLGGSRTDK